MAFPTTGVLDDFNRANQDPIAGGWSAGGINTATNGLEVVSNQLAGDASGNAYWDTSVGPDCEAFLTLPTIPGLTSYVALFARLREVGAATFDGYAVVVIGGLDWTWSIRRYDNGAGTVLGTNITTPNLAAGDAVGLEIIGDAVRALHRPSAGSWTEVGSRTDATHGAAGFLGVETGDIAMRGDDLGGGTVVEAVSGLLRIPTIPTNPTIPTLS